MVKEVLALEDNAS